MIELRQCSWRRRQMSKLINATLHLFGSFAIEADAGHPVAILVRSKKGRALLAYLAMKPDYRARRDELATLFWGDNPDALARHSLRQCLLSLRQDLSFASEILIVERETVGLSAKSVFVDARNFMSLARSNTPESLGRATELWHDGFLADLDLDIEEFDTWRRQEANRLSAAAAAVFEVSCRHAVLSGDGDSAIAAAERLVGLDPTNEDRQRILLKLLARHRGREAAMSWAKQLVEFLRVELGVSPEAATRALIDAIKRGDFEPAPEPDHAPHAQNASVSTPAIATRPLANPTETSSGAAAKSTLGETAGAGLPFWRGAPRPAIGASIALLSIVTIAVLATVIELKPGLTLIGSPRNQAAAVLPFTTDYSGQSDDSAFARILTHNLIGYLSRFDSLRVISEEISDSYRNRPTDIAHLKANLNVQYAIVGRVQSNNNVVKIDFQLVDTATRTNVWSDVLQQERADLTVSADDGARGIARMLAFEIGRVRARSMRASPSSQLTPGELVAQGYLALQNGTVRVNLLDAITAFRAALQRDPQYRPALLGIARVQIIAAMNFVDLDSAYDLADAERLVNESLAKSPNSVSALYSLALLQKYRHQYQASIRSMQRCLELNPSFLPAQGQIGNMLTRMGQPEKGLEQILRTIRTAVADDPTMGYWYLFAAEAELELGHDQAALDWALRASAVMPEASLVQAWLASIYATIGNKPAAAKYTAALTKAAPMRTQIFLNRAADDRIGDNGQRRTRIFNGLRLALGQLG
jgi:DNA-binding SARP family transcriptional activator/TolB-like protein